VRPSRFLRSLDAISDSRSSPNPIVAIRDCRRVALQPGTASSSSSEGSDLSTAKRRSRAGDHFGDRDFRASIGSIGSSPVAKQPPKNRLSATIASSLMDRAQSTIASDNSGDALQRSGLSLAGAGALPMLPAAAPCPDSRPRSSSRLGLSGRAGAKRPAKHLSAAQFKHPRVERILGVE